jgi:cytochrome c-type biogenesis protein
VVSSPSLLLAFAAGFVSFVSPCCLPLVPGYLATVFGVATNEPRRFDPRVLARALVFVASFSSVFIVLGLTSTLLGSFLFDNQPLLNKLAGAAIIAMGLLFAASVFVTRINVQWRPQALLQRAGRGGPALAGVAFAIGWTPCIGPTLGAILGIAATQAGTGQGALLLAVYSAGLAIPFLLSAIAFNGAQRSFAFFRRHHAAITVGSGLLLVAMGALIASGELFQLNIEVRKALSGLGLDQLWGI